MIKISPADLCDVKTVGTLITVGFMPTPFNRLFDLLLSVVHELPHPIIIQRGALQNHKIFELVDIVVDFVSSQQMREWAEKAIVIVSHAGVGNVKLANSFGKAPILVPRIAVLGEHIDDHQTELAEILSSAGLAIVVPLEATHSEFSDIITRVKYSPLQSMGKMQIELPVFNITGTVLAVSSVGGHRAELNNLKCEFDGVDVIHMTDEICEEVKSGAYARFPSCNKRRHILIRFLQAMAYLISHSEIKTVITTGAGVGAVFVAAAKLLGIRTISVESMTRINAPGLWFKLAGRISDEAYAYSWSHWVSNFPRVKKIQISIKSR